MLRMYDGLWVWEIVRYYHAPDMHGWVAAFTMDVVNTYGFVS